MKSSFLSQILSFISAPAVRKSEWTDNEGEEQTRID